MKKTVFFLLILLLPFICSSQILRNDKYEIYLINIEENQVNIAKGMYMTDRFQFYYEGTIEVISMRDGKSVKYDFFFSTWDDAYKEFLIKDKDRNDILPKIFFKDKKNALIKIVDEIKSTELVDNSDLNSSILSSMVVWLENHNAN